MAEIYLSRVGRHGCEGSRANVGTISGLRRVKDIFSEVLRCFGWAGATVGLGHRRCILCHDFLDADGRTTYARDERLSGRQPNK